MAKNTTPDSLYGNSRDILREAERENEILADIAGEEYESPGDIPKGKYVIEKRLLDAAQKKNELLESIAEGSGGGGGAAKAIGIDYATDVISLKNKDGETIAGSGATLPAYGVTFDPTTGGLTLTKNGTAVSGQTVTIPNYGSPVGVTDSADMVDEGTIYLYEGTTGGGFTNGHFYYYDGTAWADGGEYAAATVQTDKTLLVEGRAADAKATGDAVGDLKTQLNDLENVTTERKTIYVRQDLTWTPGFVAYEGTIGSSTAYIYSSKISVKTGDELRIVNTTNHANVANGIYLCAYNGDTPIPESGKSDTYSFPYAVPDGVDGVIVTLAKAYLAGNPCAYIKRDEILPAHEDVIANLESVQELEIGNLKPNKYINSANGNEADLNGISCTGFLPVDGNQKYIIHTDFVGSAGGAFYDVKKVFVSGIEANFGGEKDYEVTSPRSARYIRFSVHGSITPSIKHYISETDLYNTLNDAITEYMDISMFDSMGVCGDSYTRAQFWNGNTVIGDNEIISWGKIIERMKGINVSVYASSGANTETWQTNSRCLPALLADTPKRLYIFNLGINDSGNISLGTIEDIHENYLDNPSTFYGNWGRIIDQVKAHAPNAKMLLMKCWLVPSGYYNYGSTAIEEISSHYNIPYLDTAENSFFLSTAYATKSGGHPTPTQQSGMAKAVCQLVAKCMQNNPDYFNDYYPA